VVASDHPGTFSLGGDLAYFLNCIDRDDRTSLEDYAHTCIDAQIATARHYGLPVTTLSVIEGECLGGGFECALASSVLIADETSRFAFPELTFGMFPGMGALALLLRKVSPAVARRLILEQAVYTAAELHELGVVDIVARPGQARDAARTYMRENIKRHAGLHGLQVAIDHALPINSEEFTAVVEEWVDTAFRLSDSNRRLMDYLARGQQRRHPERVEDNVNVLRQPFA
jgi:DSF synthase